MSDLREALKWAMRQIDPVMIETEAAGARYDECIALCNATPPADAAAQEQIARYRLALERIVAGPGPSCDSPEQQAQWDCSVARAALHPTQGGQ